MIGNLLDEVIDFVTSHNRIVILVMLVLTVGMTVGVTQLETASRAGGNSLPATAVDEKADYVAERYGGEDDGNDVATALVYVRDEGGNALSKDALVDTLRYQQAVMENDSVAGAIPEDGQVVSVAGLVAKQAAGDSGASLDAQISTLESTSESEVESLVQQTLAQNARAVQLLPNSYEPGTATADSQRILFQFERTEDGEAPADATRALFEAAGDRDAPDYFTLGQHASSESQTQSLANTVWLVIPVALVLILGVLAFTYRDLVDVVVGMIGVIVSILWMFGILGWFQVSAGITMIIGPVLIAGLSIDYGFHVFMRYREQRGVDEDVRPPMSRSLRGVSVALGLVTLTTAIGFLSNVVNPLDDIRTLGIGITFGVVSAFVIFVTLIPALKISVDGLLERVGLDRRKRPLGEGAFLKPVLRSSIVLARRAAPVVIVVTLIAGAGAATTWTALDEQPFSRPSGEVAEWKTELPGPVGWDSHAYVANNRYVLENYRTVAQDASDRFQILIQGDVTSDGTLVRIQDGVDRAEENGALAGRSAETSITSPLTVMQSVAQGNDEFASTFREADANGDGVPDRNLEAVYDHLYEVAPDRASTVIERTDGEYRSVRVIGPADGGGTLGERADSQNEVAATVEGDDSGLTVTAVSTATVQDAGIGKMTDGILQVMVLALTAVFVVFVVISRLMHGSASLGAVTVVPIALVTGLVVGGMYVLDVPLTVITALLMSLVIGLGIDYNIHVSDRFAQELHRGRAPFDALETAVVSTGGALLGSALTTVVAFTSIVLHPYPALQNLGTMVTLALAISFLVSVFVLPSMLTVWTKHFMADDFAGQSASADPAPMDD